MNNIEMIMASFQRHQGFLTFQQVLEEKLPYKMLLRMIDEGQVEVEGKGLYRLPDTYLERMVCDAGNVFQKEFFL